MELNKRLNVAGNVLERRDDGVTDIVTDDGVWFRSQNIDEIVKRNTAERNNDKFRGFRLAPEFRKVASIPVAVIDIAKAQGIDLMHDAEAMKRFLNDPRNLAFRTTLETV